MVLDRHERHERTPAPTEPARDAPAPQQPRPRSIREPLPFVQAELLVGSADDPLVGCPTVLKKW